MKKREYDQKGIARVVQKITRVIIEENKGAQDIVLLGVLDGGVEFANYMAKIIKQAENEEVEVGKIDVSYNNPNFMTNESGVSAEVVTKNINIKNKKVIIVTGTIVTGETAWAAVNAVHEFTRPKSTHIATLLQSENKRVKPIYAEYVGKVLPISSSEDLIVTWEKIDGIEEAGIISRYRDIPN